MVLFENVREKQRLVHSVQEFVDVDEGEPAGSVAMAREAGVIGWYLWVAHGHGSVKRHQASVYEGLEDLAVAVVEWPVGIQEKMLDPRTDMEGEPFPEEPVLVPEHRARSEVVCMP
jgi:hypothetical protein